MACIKIIFPNLLFKKKVKTVFILNLNMTFVKWFDLPQKVKNNN